MRQVGYKIFESYFYILFNIFISSDIIHISIVYNIKEQQFRLYKTNEFYSQEIVDPN